MEKYTLDELCQVTKELAPRVDSVGKELKQLREEIEKLNDTMENLLDQQKQVESSITSIQSQIAQLQSQASSSDDDDDDSGEILSQISALQGRLQAYQSLLSEIYEGIEQTSREITKKQESANVCVRKLEKADEELVLLNDGFGVQLRDSVQAKDVITRTGAKRFASSSASEQVAVLQKRINTCMSYQSKIGVMRSWIQQYLGDERGQREKVKTYGRAR